VCYISCTLRRDFLRNIDKSTESSLVKFTPSIVVLSLLVFRGGHLEGPSTYKNLKEKYRIHNEIKFRLKAFSNLRRNEYVSHFRVIF